MLPYFSGDYGNPSSVHAFGRAAERAVEQARRDVADVLNCAPGEIVFTSCGSEADNLALRGAALAVRAARGANHIVTTPVEHHAVGHTARQLSEHFGFELTVVPVDAQGRVDPEDVAEAIRPGTALVSVMLANNEVGTIQPVAEIARLARERGVLVHTDAVQAASQLDVDVERLGVDLMALGAHKFYGPKGVGALCVRQGTPLLPTQTGGGHERGLRAGTHNVPYIVGMAKALRLTAERREQDNARFARLRDRLIEEIPAKIPEARLTGHRTERLPNHASFAFKGVDGNELLMHLDVAGIAASSGSACKTGDPEPSEVLLAMGLPREWALGSLRLTVGRGTTHAHIDHTLAKLPDIVAAMRALAA
jgi:cysteine desulfurase